MKGKTENRGSQNFTEHRLDVYARLFFFPPLKILLIQNSAGVSASSLAFQLQCYLCLWATWPGVCILLQTWGVDITLHSFPFSWIFNSILGCLLVVSYGILYRFMRLKIIRDFLFTNQLKNSIQILTTLLNSTLLVQLRSSLFYTLS